MAGFGSIIGGIGSAIGGFANLAGAGGKGGAPQYKEIVRIFEKLPDLTFEDFETGEISPRELQIVAEYFPQAYEAFVPQDIKTAADSPLLRQAQQRGLAQMEQYATQGTTPGEQAAIQQATTGAMQANRRMTDATLQNLAMRGRLGGGTEIQSRLAASQGAANLAGDMGLGLAQQMGDRRFAATAMVPEMAGQMRQQDIGLRQFNADVINRANQMAADWVNQARYANMQQRAAAEGANVSRAQQVGDYNTQMSNAARFSERDMRNQLRQVVQDNALRKAEGMAGALGGLARSNDAQAFANQQNIMGLGAGLGQAVGGILDYGYGGGGEAPTKKPVATSAPTPSTWYTPYDLNKRISPQR